MTDLLAETSAEGATPRGGVSRRSVVKTAAWATPAVVVVTAAPAIAFSGPGGTKGVLAVPTVTMTRTSWTSAIETDYHSWPGSTGPTGTYTYQAGPPTYGTKANGSTGGTAADQVLHIKVSGVKATASGTTPDTITVAVTVPHSTLTDSSATIRCAGGVGGTASVPVGLPSSSTGWQISNTVVPDTTAHTVKFTFTVAIAPNVTASDLEFECVFPSSAGTRIYPFVGANKTVSVLVSAPNCDSVTGSATATFT